MLVGVPPVSLWESLDFYGIPIIYIGLYLYLLA